MEPAKAVGQIKTLPFFVVISIIRPLLVHHFKATMGRPLPITRRSLTDLLTVSVRDVVNVAGRSALLDFVKQKVFAVQDHFFQGPFISGPDQLRKHVFHQEGWPKSSKRSYGLQVLQGRWPAAIA